jgi:hypothetical protein
MPRIKRRRLGDKECEGDAPQMAGEAVPDNPLRRLFANAGVGEVNTAPPLIPHWVAKSNQDGYMNNPRNFRSGETSDSDDCDL